jgi:hypothetical protein
MAAPGFPVWTSYYPYVAWGFYRQGTSVALKKSRAHFYASWGIFDPISGTYPTTTTVIGGSEYPFALELI